MAREQRDWSKSAIAVIGLPLILGLLAVAQPWAQRAEVQRPVLQVPSLTFPSPPGASADRAQPEESAVETHLYSNPISGPRNTILRLSGDGFEPGATVKVILHTTVLGRTRTDDRGAFSNVAFAIPESFSEQPMPIQYRLLALSPLKTGQTEFTVTP